MLLGAPSPALRWEAAQYPSNTQKTAIGRLSLPGLIQPCRRMPTSPPPTHTLPPSLERLHHPLRPIQVRLKDGGLGKHDAGQAEPAGGQAGRQAGRQAGGQAGREWGRGRPGDGAIPVASGMRDGGQGRGGSCGGCGVPLTPPSLPLPLPARNVPHPGQPAALPASTAPLLPLVPPASLPLTCST